MGSVRKILEPGDGRVKPLCALYHDCGGCQLQHIPYKSQLEWKGRIVADALKRIGGLSDIEPPTVVASPEVTEYRSRMTFTLRRLRGGHIAAGFYGLHRPAHVGSTATVGLFSRHSRFGHEGNRCILWIRPLWACPCCRWMGSNWSRKRRFGLQGCTPQRTRGVHHC